jgi:hypothetical protein
MSNSASEPKVRHEFVGMMFAVTIGEVGLQVASLVQAKHYVHFLPFYFHLLLATIVITSSWVGWSLSQAPGARRDVDGVFSLGFLTLLLDVFLVVTYFIMVRTIEVGKGVEPSRIDPPEKVAGLIALMFGLYFIWDFITKILAYNRNRDGEWWRNCGLRMIPTSVCLVLALFVRWEVKGFDLEHYINADVALIALALSFRAFKDIISEAFPRTGKSFHRYKVVRAVVCSVACLLVLCLGIVSAKYSWPVLPADVKGQIESPANNDANLMPAIKSPQGPRTNAKQ